MKANCCDNKNVVSNRVFNTSSNIEDPAAIKQILAHLERKAEAKEYTPITGEQGTAPNRFVRITDETCLTQPIHQIAANKSSGR